MMTGSMSGRLFAYGITHGVGVIKLAIIGGVCVVGVVTNVIFRHVLTQDNGTIQDMGYLT